MFRTCGRSRSDCSSNNCDDDGGPAEIKNKQIAIRTKQIGTKQIKKKQTGTNQIWIIVIAIAPLRSPDLFMLVEIDRLCWLVGVCETNER